MKKFSLIILTPILLIVLAVAALLLFVDPNQFKPLIVEQTKNTLSSTSLLKVILAGSSSLVSALL
ncbi:hypothetical protein JCM19236_6665 [Vibrio sp. JCM 19236]|nr:hypothetical protein JCM19236_6665 [Vibrio sp. JCM 19236]